ncbi:uncharacterized protein A4U43_C07F9780 [Asparagus officinalis]|uniref:Uncharacterized protein n=1 Tax=Asparagus officinalis TaxID=4686 RepID=A0A5P1EAR1_ASPOF|nr:uncharacterized protein A4U43_C07F9780 [Asparagus officinalis]
MGWTAINHAQLVGVEVVLVAAAGPRRPWTRGGRPQRGGLVGRCAALGEGNEAGRTEGGAPRTLTGASGGRATGAVRCEWAEAAESAEGCGRRCAGPGAEAGASWTGTLIVQRLGAVARVKREGTSSRREADVVALGEEGVDQCHGASDRKGRPLL